MEAAGHSFAVFLMLFLFAWFGLPLYFAFYLVRTEGANLVVVAVFAAAGDSDLFSFASYWGYLQTGHHWGF